MKRASLILIGLVLAGCTTAPKPVTQLATPTFDWTPPESAAPNSTNVSFGVVAGVFSKPEVAASPFGKRFSSSLAADFLELLTAKGFTVSGPYATVNEMTYPEKKNADLILVPEVDLEPQIRVVAVPQMNILTGMSGYKYDGDSFMQGRITLAVMESLSGQRMWSKSIELPASKMPFHGQTKYATAVPGNEYLLDPALVAVQSAQLEQYYNDVLAKAWTYLNAEEMQQTKAAAQDVRAKTTFSGNK